MWSASITFKIHWQITIYYRAPLVWSNSWTQLVSTCDQIAGCMLMPGLNSDKEKGQPTEQWERKVAEVETCINCIWMCTDVTGISMFLIPCNILLWNQKLPSFPLINYILLRWDLSCFDNKRGRAVVSHGVHPIFNVIECKETWKLPLWQRAVTARRFYTG